MPKSAGFVPPDIGGFGLDTTAHAFVGSRGGVGGSGIVFANFAAAFSFTQNDCISYAANVGNGQLQDTGAPCGTGTVTSIATTAPITGGTITTTGTIACATCVTSAASLANGGVVLGTAGTQATATSTQLTFVAPTLTVGLAGTSSGIFALTGSTSGQATFTAPAVAGTTTNAVVSSNNISAPAFVSTVTTGTAPFVVASTTNVANLNASSLGGATFAAPGAIGGTTPSSGAFSSLSCGVLNTTSCIITGFGSTSGTALITWPAVAGTINNAVTFSNAIVSSSGITGTSITSTGIVNAAAASALCINARSCIRSTADGIISLDNNANGAGGLTQAVFGLIGNATNPELLISGLNMDVRRGDGTTGGGTLSINGGTPVKGILSATGTLAFANQAAIGCNDLTITVTGAALGDTVSIGVPNGSIINGTAMFSGWVSATNTVTVRYCNLVSGQPASGTFRATVTQF